MGRLATTERLVSYPMIALLQLKVLWGIWSTRDLTGGDTSSYFVSAYRWYRDQQFDTAWSPAYTAFYGSLLHVSRDVYVLNTVHRLIIVFAATFMVLALMRRFLPGPLAWLIAAWWTILPFNYDTLYEVHLFALLPVVACWLLLSQRPGSWRRGAALAVLVAAASLVRNEILVSAVVVAVGLLCWEMTRARRAFSGGGARASLFVYGVCLLGAALLIGAAYDRGIAKFPDLSSHLRAKRAIFVCQGFAFGHLQRHPEWGKSPWFDCGPLMEELFGRSDATLVEAIRANPERMFEHFAWNAGLIGSGLQILLFGVTAGSVNPDYVTTPLGVRYANWLSAGVILVVGAGALAMARRWREVRAKCLDGHMWTLLAMFGTFIQGVVVMITVRPRSAYLFAFELVLLTTVGLCAYAVWLALVPVRPSMGTSTVVLACLGLTLIAIVPSYEARNPPDVSPWRRPLLQTYRRLRPFEEQIQVPGRVLLAPVFGGEMCHYLQGREPVHCKALEYFTLQTEFRERPRDWPAVLQAHGANMFYGNELVLGDAASQRFVHAAPESGWGIVARGGAPPGWILWERAPTAR